MKKLATDVLGFALLMLFGFGFVAIVIPFCAWLDQFGIVQ